jgi:hypothetical protein
MLGRAELNAQTGIPALAFVPVLQMVVDAFEGSRLLGYYEEI